jgi:hypothetical protein
MKISAPLVFVSLFLAACSSVEKVGTSAYQPLASNEEVTVFTADNQIKQPFEVVGIISYNNPGKFQVLTLGHAREPLKAKARQVGAKRQILSR